MSARIVTKIGGKTHLSCCRCNRLLPQSDFYTTRGGDPHCWCKPCYSDWRKARRESQHRLAASAPRVARGRQRIHPTPETSAETACLQAGFLSLRSPMPAGFTGRPVITTFGVSP